MSGRTATLAGSKEFIQTETMGKKCIPAAVALVCLATVPSLPARARNTQLAPGKKIVHALRRLTFGPRPEDFDRVSSMGLTKWIDLQLHPERIPENPVLEAKLQPLASLRMSPAEMVEKYPQPERRAVAQDLTQAKIYRAIYSNRQLEEVLIDFWYNHFNVFLDKGADRYLVTAYERDAIRPHVLGKFEHLLKATAESPAMLFYLDNWQSVDPNAAGRFTGKKQARRGLNENYARELMELHTLGVDGGYTQKDVTEVARCFTGWTIREPRRGGGFAFNERMHDRGEKIVLGVKITAGGGQEDGVKVLHILARHPSTARFISRKLATRFVADDPPASLVAKMAKTFSRKNGDLREVLKTMLASQEFWSENAYRAKVKSPLEMIASAVRAMDGEVESGSGLVRQIANLGQPLYRKQEPTGYSNVSGEWVNSAALLARMNFALALAGNRIPGVRVDTTRTTTALTLEELSEETKKVIGNASQDPQTTVAGLVMGSPEFQRR